MPKKLKDLERMNRMNNFMIKNEKNEIELNRELTYKKVNSEINTIWPQWKKEAYNEMFAVSTHATKIEIER